MRYEKYGRTEYNNEMKKKNTYDPEFKSKVVLELISPVALSGWHKQFQEHAAEVLRCGEIDSSREIEEK